MHCSQGQVFHEELSELQGKSHSEEAADLPIHCGISRAPALSLLPKTCSAAAGSMHTSLLQGFVPSALRDPNHCDPEPKLFA